MRWRAVSFPAFAAVSWLAGCGGSGATPGDARGNLLLHDQNNYTTKASLSIPVRDTVSAMDLDICWSDIVDDLQCHPLSAAADIDNVALLRISHLSQEQVQIRVAEGTLSQS